MNTIAQMGAARQVSNQDRPKRQSHRPKTTDFTPQEALDLANAIAARDRAIARTRSSRPIIFQRDGGFTRAGALMAGVLAEAYSAAYGEPEPAPQAEAKGGL